MLRHTYASRLAMKGLSMAAIAAALGHGDERVAKKPLRAPGAVLLLLTWCAAFGATVILPTRQQGCPAKGD
jgi:hypothetical protein